MSCRVVFVAPTSILDTRSGAATSMRTALSWLAEAGWDAQSITPTVFDGDQAYPLAKILGSEGASNAHIGRCIRLKQDGVQHNVIRLSSTVVEEVEEHEKHRFLAFVDRILDDLKPDVVIGYGGNALSMEMWRVGRRHSGKLVFYLANPNYQEASDFELVDHVLCPSHYLKEHYNELLDLRPYVFNCCVGHTHFESPSDVLAHRGEGARRGGFVTFINPSPSKGATLVYQLACLAAQERPDLTFLCVEGRASADQWRRAGADFAGLPNVWWLPNQADMRRVYRRTSVLLFPSFWPEPSGRSIIEAQLGGIPVLATKTAGIPETLNGGGVLFDIPEGCAQNYGCVPSAEAVRPWLDEISRLMDHDGYYQDAVERASAASAPFHPACRKADVADQFERLVAENNG